MSVNTSQLVIEFGSLFFFFFSWNLRSAKLMGCVYDSRRGVWIINGGAFTRKRCQAPKWRGEVEMYLTWITGGGPAVRGLRTWPVTRSHSLIGDWRKILEGLNVTRCSYNREDLTDAAPYRGRRRESCPAVGRGCRAPPWSFIFPERRLATSSSLQTADDLFARQRNSWSKLSAVDKDDKYHHLKWQTRQWHPSGAVKETRPAFHSFDKWMRQRGERGT